MRLSFDHEFQTAREPNPLSDEANDTASQDLIPEDDEQILANANIGLARVQSDQRQKRNRPSGAGGANAPRGSVIVAITKKLSLLTSRQAIDEVALWKIGQYLDQQLVWWSFLDTLYVVCTVPFRIGFLFEPWHDMAGQTDTWNATLTVFSILDAMGMCLRLWILRKEFRQNRNSLLFWKQLSTHSRWSSGGTMFGSKTSMPRFFSTIKRVATLSTNQIVPSPSSILHASDRMGSASSVAVNTTATGAANSEPSANMSEHKNQQELDRQHHQMPHQMKALIVLVHALVVLLENFPLEFVMVCVHYNWLHVAGVGRLVACLFYFSQRFEKGVLASISKSNWLSQQLSFSLIRTAHDIFWMGLFLCHLTACGYMFLAHFNCSLDFSKCNKQPVPECWVLKDNMEQASLARQYLRSMYWASKTVTTLGQGDLVPANWVETYYCSFVQYISGIWATSFLAACSFYFSNRDANVDSSMATRLQQTLQFIKARDVPSSVKVRVQTYYQYMQRTRDGVQEDHVLSLLPNHYRLPCSQYVKHRLLRKIPFFRRQPGAFLRTVMRYLENDFFAPDETILDADQPDEFLLVIVGDVRLENKKKMLLKRLTKGDYYGLDSLFRQITVPNSVVADTFCEIWWLSKSSFDMALRKHFNEDTIAMLLASNRRETMEMMASGDYPTTVSGKDTKESVLARHHVASWRLPGSSFRKHWQRIKLFALIVVAIEVPFHIAFLRGFGFFDGEDGWAVHSNADSMKAQWRERMEYMCSLIGELFFYVDWYFETRRFVRMTRALMDIGNYDQLSSGNAQSARQGTSHHRKSFKNTTSGQDRANEKDKDVHADDGETDYGMILDPPKIFLHYLDHDHVWADLLSNLPVSLLWDLVPKSAMSTNFVFTMRFFRLIRLLRLVRLRRIMKEIMNEINMSPSSQLLAFVCVFSGITAQFMGCLFFLIADADGYLNGIPRAGFAYQEYGSLSASQCLEDASIHGNCTWLMYDYSNFAVDSSYIRSMHWSLVLLSTVGYGDILSYTTIECVVGFWWIYIGALVCYFTSCAVSSAISQANIVSVTLSKERGEINRYLSQLGAVHAETKTTIRNYYEGKWKLNGSTAEESEICKHLPRSIHHELAWYLYFHPIAGSDLFSQLVSRDRGTRKSVTRMTTERLVREIALVVHTEFFLKDTMIVEAGQVNQSMYVVESGEVEQLLPETALSAIPRTSLCGVPIATRDATGQERGRKRFAFVRGGAMATKNPTGSLLSEIIDRDARAKLTLARRSNSEDGRLRSGMIPISILKQLDCFCEEAVFIDEPTIASVGARSMVDTQLIVMNRDDIMRLNLPSRLKHEWNLVVDAVKTKKEKDSASLEKFKKNLVDKKINKHTRECGSLYASSSFSVKRLRRTFANSARDASLLKQVLNASETKWFRQLRRVIHFMSVIDFYLIVFRIAFIPRLSFAAGTKWFIVDCVLDSMILVETCLARMQFHLHGMKGRAARRTFKLNCIALCTLPLAPIAWLLHISTPSRYESSMYFFNLSFLRLTRLVRVRQLLAGIEEVERKLEEVLYMRRGSPQDASLMEGTDQDDVQTSSKTIWLGVFQLCKFFVYFFSAAHVLGSTYFLVGRVLVDHKVVKHSWINWDPILKSHPDNIAVQYIRCFYWCLETFTVVCFGDVLARNGVETVYSASTCVLGWMFIAQITSKITALITNLNMEALENDALVQDFDQYARRKKLPPFLRQRAMESLSYKIESKFESRLHEFFKGLPCSLMYQLFDEVYGPYLRRLPEFQCIFSKVQLQELASKLRLEIYLAEDLIYEQGKACSGLFIVKEGRAEYFLIDKKLTLGPIYQGQMFGDLSFFLSVKRLASVRCVSSSQILKLEKSDWLTMWPESVRFNLEQSIIPLMKDKHKGYETSFRNIMINFNILEDQFIEPTTKAAANMPWQGGSNHPTAQDPATTKGGLSDIQISKVKHLLSSGTKKSFKLTRLLLGANCSMPSASPRKTKSRRENGRLSLSAPSANKMHPKPMRSQSERGPARRFDFFQGIDKSNLAVTPRRSTLTKLNPGHGLMPNFTLEQQQRHQKQKGGASPSSVSSRNAQINRKSSQNGSQKTSAERKSLSVVTAIAIKAKRSMDLSPDNKQRDGTTIQDPSRESWVMAGRKDSQQPTTAIIPSPDLQEESTSREDSRNLSFQLKNELVSFFMKPHAATTRFLVGVRSKSILIPQRKQSRHGHQANDEKTMLELSIETFEHPKMQRLKMLEARFHRRQQLTQVQKSNAKKNKVIPVNEPTISSAQVKENDFNNYGVWIKPPSPPEYCLETSQFRRLWTMLMFAVCLYFITVLPFRAAFLHEFLETGSTFTRVWFAFEYVLDVLCFVDFYLQQEKFAYYDGGELISDAKTIRAHFRQAGSYRIDLMTLMPIEVVLIPIWLWTCGGFQILSNVQSFWFMLGVFRLNRALRVYHWPELSQKLRYHLLYDFSISLLAAAKPSFLYFVSFGLDYALGAHWVACFYYGFAYHFAALEQKWFDGSKDVVASWLTTAGMLSFDGFTDLSQLGELSAYKRYSRSFYYSISAITTVSYGDIAPQNAWETLVTIAVIIMSFVLFGLLTGWFVKAYEMDFGKQAQYEEKIAQVASYMNFYRFSPVMWKRMQVYYAVSWQQTKGMNEAELLRGLHHTMKQDVALFVQRDFVLKLKLFESCDECFVRAMVASFDRELYVRNDVIIEEGDYERSLYVIESGIVSVRIAVKKPQPLVPPAPPFRNDFKPDTSLTIRDISGNSGVEGPDADKDPDRVIAIPDSPSSRTDSHTAINSVQEPQTIEVIKTKYDFIGEKSLLFDVPRSATCVALCTTTVMILTVEKYEQILQDFPEYREKNMRDWIFKVLEQPQDAKNATPSMLTAASAAAMVGSSSSSNRSPD